MLHPGHTIRLHLLLLPELLLLPSQCCYLVGVHVGRADLRVVPHCERVRFAPSNEQSEARARRCVDAKGSLTLLHHLLRCKLLRIQVTQSMRVGSDPRHTLASRWPAHLSSARMLSTHSGGPRRICAGRHARHGSRLCGVRLPWARGTRMSHLLHLRAVHGLTGRHGRMAVRCYSRVHSSRLRLVRHHLVPATRLLFIVLMLVARTRNPTRAGAAPGRAGSNHLESNRVALLIPATQLIGQVSRSARAWSR